MQKSIEIICSLEWFRPKWKTWAELVPCLKVCVQLIASMLIRTYAACWMATWNSDLSNVMGYCVEASTKTQLESSAEWNPCQPCTLVSYQKSIPKYSQVTLSGWKSKHYAKSAMRWALHSIAPWPFKFWSVGNSRNKSGIWTSFVFSHRGRCRASFVQLQLQAAATRQAPAGSTWRVRTQPGDSAI